MHGTSQNYIQVKRHLTQKNSIVAILLMCLFSSCLKSENGIDVENITKGEKWGVRIGSSAEEVFARLQQLGNENGFSTVAVVYRQPYSKPEDIQHSLNFYDYITLQKEGSPYVERTTFGLRDNKVNTIKVGGAHLEEVDKWPKDVSEETSIGIGNPIDEFYRKLLAIYQLPGYADYTITLPDKPLDKSFDADMENYDEWAFSFFIDTKEITKQGRSSARLYFKNGNLTKIRHEYVELEVVID